MKPLKPQDILTAAATLLLIASIFMTWGALMGGLAVRFFRIGAGW